MEKENNILSGNCLKDFEEWLSTQKFGIVLGFKHHNLSTVVDLSEYINNIPKAMQWGVYQDFFDSQGVKIVINYWWCQDNDAEYFNFSINQGDEYDYFDTRQEARQAAIERANAIYNESTRKGK